MSWPVDSPTEKSPSSLRVPFIIDGVMIISAVIWGTQLYTKMQYLEQQYVSSVTVAKLEGKIDRIDDKIDRNVNDLLKIDENSKRDRDSLHQRQEEIRQRIDRLERDRR